ncbi:MAG TPA: MarR family transcriptional regulator [Actinomycetota bacterium]
MQRSRDATIERAADDLRLAELADAFEAHWAEVARFVLNKRWKAAMYSGPEAHLSHLELAALTLLGDRDFRMGDLAAQIGLSESSATRLVDRLAAAGLVERRASLADRRSVSAGLTAEGRKSVTRIRDGRRRFLTEILTALPADERAELVRLFGRVADELRLREGSSEAHS